MKTFMNFKGRERPLTGMAIPPLGILMNEAQQNQKLLLKVGRMAEKKQLRNTGRIMFLPQSQKAIHRKNGN